MIMPRRDAGTLIVEDVNDPAALAASTRQREQYTRNWRWFQANVDAIFSAHRGQCICVAGEQLFVADTPESALALAAAAHPDDQGRFVHYIPRQKVQRIYAH